MTDNSEGSEPIKLTEEMSKQLVENIEKQIQTIKVNQANLDHIGKSGEINGSLFVDIKNLLLEKETELNKVKEDLFVERHLVKVKQKEKEMMAEQLKEERNKAIDECIERLSSYRDIDRTQMKEELQSLKK